ncbi:hypothetical protein FACS1894216_19000 [Synergistales bacterium]|nr:hypothetical protein FACS1894216_19000 [Synergistales bacterium]
MRINVLEYLEKTASERPDRIAVIDGGVEIDFRTLVERAKKLALFIHEKLGGVIRAPIAVYLPKSAESVIADTAILFSGNCYMNLDVKSPISRVNAVIKQTSPVLLITDDKHLEAVAGGGGYSKRTELLI